MIQVGDNLHPIHHHETPKSRALYSTKSKKAIKNNMTSFCINNLKLHKANTILINIRHNFLLDYILVTSGYTCSKVTSNFECSTAAAYLGMSVGMANDVNIGGVAYAPPYCYVAHGILFFNPDGLNTGECTSSESCICRAGVYFGQIDSFLLIYIYIYITLKSNPFKVCIRKALMNNAILSSQYI